MTTKNQNKAALGKPSRIVAALMGATLLASAAPVYAQGQTPGGQPPQSEVERSLPPKPDARRHQKPQRMVEHRGGERDHGPHRSGPGRRGPGGPMMFSPAKVAEALSTLETGIGIQPDQMEAWRSFTGAVVSFTEAVQPPRMGPPREGRPGDRGPGDTGPDAGGPLMGPDDQAPQPGDAGPDASPPSTVSTPQDQGNGFRALDMLDRFADRAVDAGEKAQALKSAIADLKTVLTPEQAATAQALVRDMMRDARGDRGPGMRGPGMHRGPDRDERRGHHEMRGDRDGPRHGDRRWDEQGRDGPDRQPSRG
ncbi:hypothetical protein SAMN06297251_12162 [Fulvimarina manganoxydans]|uniref:LTXXQ motif family protein n=1 Tax=Fulvimarina manganoxydans TaxID=937218 RepID=A0A1W2E5L8_9HYPH|nr:hypothetical protein [Fulvimarina manganoxydans]MEE2952932.1 hypothetical protein [Pseudomonadota bacterium]SMD04975.1 hypothetical protein SAMN06297251_12162 [Fulvimarina manganoxydans]